jgi:hypothetical protein
MGWTTPECASCMGPVQPTITCSCVADNERIPLFIAVCPFRGASSHLELALEVDSCSIVDEGMDWTAFANVSGTEVAVSFTT